jgi:hypothetical protein
VADTTSDVRPSPIASDDLKRAEAFTREPFVLAGEDAEVALANGTPRRAAFDSALREIEGGREDPSLEWRRDFSLILGLERVLADEEPKLVDGTVLSAHQVDALSGTLIALSSEVLASSSGARSNGAKELEELPSGEVEIEGDELIEEEPLDWDADAEAEEEAPAVAQDDPGAARRFWFEHATGPARRWRRSASRKPRARAAC